MNSFLKERLEKLRDRLLDITNRNRMINSNFSARSKQFFRFIDEIPNQLFTQLQSGTMSFKAIPEENVEIRDEDTDEFKTEYDRQLISNEDYLNEIYKIEEGDSDDLNQKTEDAKRKLKDFVRSKLKLPEVSLKALTIKEAALKNKINPSFELPSPSSSDNSESKHTDKFIQTLMFKEELDTYLKTIRRISKSSQAESGVNPLYMCFGFLEWKEKSSAEKTLKSPILMAQVEFDEGKKKTDLQIKMSDNPITINQTLNEKLKANFNVELPELKFDDEDNFDIEEYLANLQKKMNNFGWQVKRIGTFGIYNAHHMPIYNDINKIIENDNASSLLEKILVGSDKEPSQDSVALYDIDKKEIEDNIPPMICDADVSQHSAVMDALSGNSFVIKGPPGTGKSQTITNIIASLMFKGKKVLFVAQKQAALDVVRNRLEEVGLSNYIVETFSAKLNKKSLMESIAKRIDTDEPWQAYDYSKKIDKFRECKSELNLYSEILNSKFAQTDTKVHDVIWDLYDIKDVTNINGLYEYITFDVKKITQLELDSDIENIINLKDNYQEIFNEDIEIKSNLLKIKKIPNTPFERDELSNDINDIKNDLEEYKSKKNKVDNTFTDLDVTEIQKHNKIIDKFIQTDNLSSLKDWKVFNVFSDKESKKILDKLNEISNQIQKLNKDLDNYTSQLNNDDKFAANTVINTSLQQINKSIAVFKKSNILSFFNSEYRKANNLYKKLFKNTSFFENKIIPLEKLYKARVSYEERLENLANENQNLQKNKDKLSIEDRETKQYISQLVVNNHEFTNFNESIEKLDDNFLNTIRNNENNVQLLKDFNNFNEKLNNKINAISDLLGISDDYSFDEQVKIINSLNESSISLNDFMDYLREINDERNSRFKDYFVAYISMNINTSFIEQYYKNIIRTLQHREIYKLFPRFDKYTHTKINKLRSQLKSTDADLRAVTKSKFIHEIYESNDAPQGKASGRVKEKTEMGLLNHICRKSRTQITMRHMFKQSFNAVTSIKPCTMMSPLTVSQLLPLGDENYDTVIIDEASQMKPEYAIGALARTKQLIVVGDQKQLPPARDFESKFNDEDDEDDIVEESILDLALTVLHPARELLFHYRSRHQDLIKFSNAKFYKNLLIPTTASLENTDRGIKYLYLKDATYTTGTTGMGGTNFLEAERAVEEAIHVMKTRPDESVGIATMNIKQANYIEDLMDKKRTEDKDVNDYIKKWIESDSKVNQFFVKNLANVQGDERDVIIVSTLFGPDSVSGQKRQTFGPIVQAGGQRRLNVLFTRAKNQLILITSLKSTDIKVEENSHEGKRIFKEYLAYAESEDREIQFGEVTGREVESPFQQWAIDVIESIPGFKADWEIGVKGFRIDIGVRHEDYPQGYLLAVETDGASYHSSKSARDRDYLRQKILESHGWEFYRIWSTDWINNPVSTKEKLVAEIKYKLQGAISKKTA